MTRQPMPSLRVCFVVAAAVSAVGTLSTVLAVLLAVTRVISGADIDAVFGMIYAPAFFLADYIGVILQRPPAGSNAPHFVAVWIAIALQWFVVGFAAAFVVTALRRKLAAPDAVTGPGAGR
jgi:hypothetical protein